MQHRKRGRTFGRKQGVRKAFVNSLAEALILREKILTTEARAKEIRPYVETMITKAKSGTIATRKNLISKLGGREKVAKKLVEVLAPRFKDRKGGYTRITKVVKKSSDGRKHAIIELV